MAYKLWGILTIVIRIFWKFYENNRFQMVKKNVDKSEMDLEIFSVFGISEDESEKMPFEIEP